MCDIALFYMSEYKYGGFPTFTRHLFKSFEAMGYDVELYKVRKTTEKKLRDFGNSVSYRNVSIGTAYDIVSSVPSLITATEYKRDKNDYLDDLLEAGAEVVIHDWTEMDRGFDAILRELEIVPVVIRKVNVDMLSNYGIPAIFIQHPYISANVPTRHRHMRAVALSRIDWDKNSHILVEANESLSPRNKIYMWGSKYNRIYMKNKIESRFPGWEGRRFTGPFYMGPHLDIPNFPVWIASNADFVVDLSVISGDGGGTQYCFLEAIDAGAILVLHRDWLLDGGLFVEDYNCLAVGSVDELVELLEYETYEDHEHIAINADSILKNHVPEVVIPQYLEILGV